MEIFDDKIPILSQAIKYSNKRHEILSHNIANLDTPNYKSKDLVFKKELNLSMEKLSASDPLSKQPEYNLSADLVVKQENKFPEIKNNIDVDMEMSKISKNTILNYTLVQLLNQKFRIIKSVFNG